MFGIGLPEMILILALALIVVGPDKLPELARSVAKGVLELKKTVTALKEDLADDNPFDTVKPELEQAAQSIKKQLGEATPDGFTGIVKDLESGLQEVIDSDGNVIEIEMDQASGSGADPDEQPSPDARAFERPAPPAGKALQAEAGSPPPEGVTDGSKTEPGSPDTAQTDPAQPVSDAESSSSAPSA